MKGLQSNTQSGRLPADHGSESISSASDDFRKSNDCGYTHTLLQQVACFHIRVLFRINSLNGAVDLKMKHISVSTCRACQSAHFPH